MDTGIMILLRFLVTTNLLIIIQSSTAEIQDNNTIAKPNCLEECGGVNIPFPFGIGDGCYLRNDTRFMVKCNTTNPKLPFPVLGTLNHHAILNVNLSHHSIRLSSGVAYQCYNHGKPASTNTNTYELDVVGFTVSATRNKFVAIGCDTTASVQDSESRPGQLDLTGCMTSCRSLQSVSHVTTCSGRGCCETPISDTMSKPRIQVSSFNNHSYVEDFNPCSFAFVGEVGSYKFSPASLIAPTAEYEKIRVPVVYDWSVFTSFRGCLEAKRAGNGAMICGVNTKCVDGDDGRGYRCECLKGFEGNPYLSQGCQDINECQDFSHNDCGIYMTCIGGEELNQCKMQQLCVNTNGSYYCTCPNGLVGNGTQTSHCAPPPTKGADKLILGLSLGITLLTTLILSYGLHKIVKRSKETNERQSNFERNGGLLLQQRMSTNEGAIDRIKIFSRIELMRATDNFNDNRVLGHGGQGTVYKGMLADGTIVAVKKSKKVDETQLAQFINEVVILSQINHRNVVKLFGCCLETEVPLLVYEFLPNGTLYQHIHNPSEEFQLTWGMRFQIAVECAGALAYLHSSSSSPVYHRDIKSSNILLDDKYRAKISDFGTSRTISIDQTHVTTRVQGTFGYLDPEFFRSNQFNDKSDVYSFGVVLLELLTSKKPVFTERECEEPRSLANEFLQLVDCPDRLYGFLDAEVNQHCSKEEIEVLARLIERCLSMNGKQRPTMKEVAMALEMAKSQHYQVPNAEVEQEIERQEHGWTDQINITNGSTFCSSSSATNSYSI